MATTEPCRTCRGTGLIATAAPDSRVFPYEVCPDCDVIHSAPDPHGAGPAPRAMTPDALRQTLEAQRTELRALADALDHAVHARVDAAGQPEQPASRSLLRTMAEVNRAALAISRAIGETELMARARAEREP